MYLRRLLILYVFSNKLTFIIADFRFPKDESLKNIWVKNINRKDWQPNSASVLCSQHFAFHFFEHNIYRTVLRRGAIPTIFEKEDMVSAEVIS